MDLVPGGSSSARRRLLFGLAVLIGLATATVATAAVPSPTVEGPITSPGSAFIESTSFDLSEVGYTQEEYFISGTATGYTSASPLTPDGKWTATPASTAPYKTRILVYKPTNPRKFNGTVMVEWLNVSGGLDAAPDWVQAHTALIRAGIAWVGVSAQIVGVEGGPALVGVVSLPLKKVNPARYGSLSHPGDSFSYDMFSQAGQAIRQPSGTNPLSGLRVKRVIAAGESQSAFRMVTYIDAVHPLAGVYQGFLVHSRGGGGPLGAALSESPQPVVAVPLPTFIRERHRRAGADRGDRDRPDASPVLPRAPGRRSQHPDLGDGGDVTCRHVHDRRWQRPRALARHRGARDHDDAVARAHHAATSRSTRDRSTSSSARPSLRSIAG